MVLPDISMWKIWRVLPLVLFFALLQACSTAPVVEQPPADIDSPEQTDPPVADDEPAHAPIRARQIEAQTLESDAIKYLLDQAQLALEEFEADKADALSRRALKIDRKSPRAYLILAKVACLEEKPQQAKSIVRQGLLYAHKHTPVGQQLAQFKRCH